MGTVHGSCHCGALSVTFTSPSAVEDLNWRQCGCGFCRRHGAIYATDPHGHLAVAAGAGALGRYRFGHGTADFLLCKTCGVLVGVAAEIDGALRGVVNLAVMDPPLSSSSPVPVVDLDGEDVLTRIERRRRHWIGHVEIKEVSS